MIIQEANSLTQLQGGGEMGEQIRAKDWSTSCLGSPDTWPASLLNSISLILNSPLPMFIVWGNEMTMFYNDAFASTIGKANPQLLGGSGLEVNDERWSEVKRIAEGVVSKKQPAVLEDQLLDISKNGITEQHYFTFSFTPIFLSLDDVGGVFCIITETIKKVISTKKIQDSEQKFRNLVTEAPVAICIVTGPEFVVDMANEEMLTFLGRTPQIIGKPIVNSLPEAKAQGLIDILEKVYKTGQDYSVSTFSATILIDGVRIEKYFDLIFKPYQQNADEPDVKSIFCVAHDVTEQVETRRKLQENETALQLKVQERTVDLERQKVFISSILDASLNGIYSLKADRNSEGKIVDFHYLFANYNISKALNRTSEELIGTSMLALIPENKTNGFFDLFCEVLETGKPVHDETHFVTQNINNWYDFVIVPIDKELVVVTLQDISEQKLALHQIEQQRNLLDNILTHSPAGITVTEVIRNDAGEVIDGKTILANNISQKYIGLTLEQMEKNTISQNDPNILKSNIFAHALQTLITGESFIMQYFFEPTKRWLEVSISKMDDDRLINVFTDVTTIKTSEFEIRQSVDRLDAVFNAAQSGMFTLSPVFNNEQEIIDFRFVITNSNFAKYLGHPAERLKGELASAWLGDYEENGLFQLYKKTFTSGETQHRDIHYKVDDNDLYFKLTSIKVGDEVLVTFNDYSNLKATQLQLEKHIEELKRSNVNLEEFAHAASHDLKEPVRKIRVFFDRLKNSLSSLSPDQQNLFARVEDAAQRMSLLIDDLLDYSHVRMGIDLLEPIDLNKKLKVVIGDLEVAIQDKKATIVVGDLPTVLGHRRQIQQLFINLIQNALKYSKSGVAPHITITAEKVLGRDTSFDLPKESMDQWYNLIKVQDNGIGFPQDQAEKIFQMFQRLHGKSEYSGSGVGLAIVRKVVENHKGYIAAESIVGEGATFKVLLPVS